MNFNAAMFYDLENLLGGYSFSRQFLAQIAIEEIIAGVRATGLVENFAVQRGYADWSHPRLHKFRRAIVKHGITPIQLAIFSRGYKNAADIQMVVDIMEVALARPAISTFVIVSGDGGFLPVVNKLHELGKAVVVCAYQSSISLDLKGVADVFVEVTEPELPEEEESRDSGHRDRYKGDVYVGNPKVVELSQKMKRAEVSGREGAIEKTRDVLSWLFDNYPELNSDGLYLSTIREALTYAIKGFKPKKYNFSKFLDFLQFACRGTDVHVVVKPPHSHLIVPRDHPVKEWRPLGEVEENVKHDESSYRNLLAGKPPAMRLPNPGPLQKLCELFALGPWSRGMEKGDIVDWLGDATQGQEVKSRDIYNFLTTIINLDILKQKPGSDDDENLLVGPDPALPARELLQTIKDVAKDKIKKALGKVEPKVLTKLFPEN